MRRTRGERIFNVFNITFLLLFAIIIIVPVLFVVRKSLDVGGLGSGISLIPREFSLFYFKQVFGDTSIYRPLMNSVFITVVGTAFSLVVNCMGAYTLSKRDLAGTRFFIFYLVIVPMLFSGGLIPSYLWIKNLGLINNMLVLILPALTSGWNMILIRNYYRSISDSLIEAATIDGATEMQTFLKIILPLSKPVISAIGLFTGVGFWNTFFSAVIFMNDPNKYTFPVKLQELINVGQQYQFDQMIASSGEDLIRANLNSEGMSSAMIIISMLPIMLVYPYLQKYFAAGIMVGSIKG